MNTTIVPPPALCTEDVHVPPSSFSVPLLHETNEILMNLVNLLQRENNWMKRVEKNQEKIPMEVATQI